MGNGMMMDDVDKEFLREAVSNLICGADRHFEHHRS